MESITRSRLSSIAETKRPGRDLAAHVCLCRLSGLEVCHRASNTRYYTLSWRRSTNHFVQIISCIDNAPSLDISYLERIMRLLVRRTIFSIDHPSDGGEPLYGLTHSSRWLVNNSDDEHTNLNALCLTETHAYLVGSGNFLSQSVKEGGMAFEKAFGKRSVWELASQDNRFNKLFNDGMAFTSRILIREMVFGYKYRFDCLRSLVDVGGGIGGMISEIVKSYPHIKGINFDLPHVITTTPVYEGVSHIAGDMFHQIPNVDAVLLKWVLHDWDDEACVKILKNV
ncbi:hypothetical protein Dsin_031482 [Dipteronia sinensis]|uniref:O-methyltransferase C-terminal domain-containing protein n=1 Tax=Dipteronia sinensis TaxID=43782 RepID=A0AAD9ZLG3_9ROSI|nr:hypothetical protein Dsin_031482 [Dipteronia sinensis]